jgi:hypothetical protein
MLTQPYPNNFQYWPSNHFHSSGGGLIPISTALISPTTILQYKTHKFSDVDSIDTEISTKKPIPSAATLLLSYNIMLYVNFIDDNELVIIEHPWRFVLPTLPDSLERKVYGT